MKTKLTPQQRASKSALAEAKCCFQGAAFACMEGDTATARRFSESAAQALDRSEKHAADSPQ